MKKLKIFTVFVVIFLIMANSSYAFQIQQDILASNSVNVNSSDFKIEKIELTKSSNAKSLALSEKCTINEVTVVDSIYSREENSKNLITTDVSTSAVSVDLSMNSLTAATQPFEVGEAANIHFTIANYGPDNAPDTSVRVDVDGSPVGNIPLGTILAGYQYNVEFDLTGPSEGTHEIKLIAQVGYGLVDTDLSNNTIIRSFVWEGIPDLVAKSFETVSGPTSLKTGQEVEFKFTVANEGTGKAVGTINNHLTINGQEVAIFSFTDLDVGYMVTVTFTVIFNEPDTYNMEIHVNKSGSIIESNSNNNIKTNSVTVLDSRQVLSVPNYSQQPYNQLCWATSAAMVISYFLDDTINRNVEIAQAEFGEEDFNHPSWNMEPYVESYTGISGTERNDPLSYTAVQYQIDHDGPIITVIDLENGGLHAEVIRGYDLDNNRVLYVDPWDGLGHRATYSYYLDNDDWNWVWSLFWR
jgi:hypothetical protein